MIDRQARNEDWQVRDEDGSTTWERATVAVLMDIRSELRRLNYTLDTTLGCRNFQQMPAVLQQIARQTDRRKTPKLVKTRRAAGARR